MTEIAKAVKEGVVNEIEKQLNDRSYNAPRSESGIDTGSSDWTGGDMDPSGASVETSGYDSSGGTSWEDYEGEIINLSTFKLECFQSSNIVRMVDDCEISSIAHENGTPHLRKGNIER